MQIVGGIWKPKIFFKILFEGASWLMQKIDGIWKPKKKIKILFEGASWLMQKIGGIWKPKFFFKIFLRELAADADSWLDLKTQISF